MMIAEIFNNQFMYQQSFKAWVSYFSRNHILIRKAIRIKEARKFQTKRRFLKNRFKQAQGHCRGYKPSNILRESPFVET